MTNENITHKIKQETTTNPKRNNKFQPVTTKLTLHWILWCWNFIFVVLNNGTYTGGDVYMDKRCIGSLNIEKNSFYIS